MSLTGYAIARRKSASSQIEFLPSDGGWITAKQDGHEWEFPGGARIFGTEDFCDGPADKGTARWGRLRAEVERDLHERSYLFAILRVEKRAEPEKPDESGGRPF